MRHAVMTGAVAALLVAVELPLGEIAAVAAAPMAFARGSIGTDVVVGLVLGVTIAVVGWLMPT